VLRLLQGCRAITPIWLSYYVDVSGTVPTKARAATVLLFVSTRAPAAATHHAEIAHTVFSLAATGFLLCLDVGSQGCVQELHVDGFHGPYAFVLSLTAPGAAWADRRFTGE
jgi:hypothetical protein